MTRRLALALAAVAVYFLPAVVAAAARCYLALVTEQETMQ